MDKLRRTDFLSAGLNLSVGEIFRFKSNNSSDSPFRPRKTKNPASTFVPTGLKIKPRDETQNVCVSLAIISLPKIGAPMNSRCFLSNRFCTLSEKRVFFENGKS